MNAKSVFFSKISISGGPGPCLAGIAIRKPHKIAIAIRKQHPSTVFRAKSRLSIEVFLRPRARTKTIDLGVPAGEIPIQNKGFRSNRNLASLSDDADFRSDPTFPRTSQG